MRPVITGTQVSSHRFSGTMGFRKAAQAQSPTLARSAKPHFLLRTGLSCLAYARSSNQFLMLRIGTVMVHLLVWTQMHAWTAETH